LLPADPNPALPAVGSRAIYPYTRAYRFAQEPVERELDALVLENALINLQVVPALGGRLWGSANRLTGQPLFYTPRRVGMINFGLRGAWYSGGVEYNFPRGHTVVSNETVPALLRRHPDGAASAIVGNVDLTRRVGWSIGLRLQPDCSSLFFDILLYNRTPLPVHYSWWLNASVPPSPALEYTNGTTEVRAHFLGRREHLGEPVSWPVHEGQDLRWYIQCAEPTSLFHLAGDERWFGFYSHDQDQGVVRIGSAADAPGLKFWNSGQAEEGYLWGKYQTSGERYANSELQTGRPETQMDYGALPAHHSLRWTEVWRPVWGLGGLTFASESVAIHLLSDGEGSSLRLLGSQLYPDCTVRVVGAGFDHRFLCSLLPDRPTSLSLPIPAVSEPLIVEVFSASGESLLSFNRLEDQTRRSVLADALQLRPGPEKTPGELTAEELVLEAERLDRRMQPLEACQLAERALATDPGLIAAHMLLARRDLKSARYEAARRHCLAILHRDPAHEAAHYLLALGDLWQGNSRQAEIELEHMLGHSYLLSAAAWFELAQLRLARQDWMSALTALRRCLERESNHVKARALCAVVYRQLGQLEQARQAISSAADLAPLDPLVRVERWRLAPHPDTVTPWEWTWVQPRSQDGADQYVDLRPSAGLLQDAVEAACDYLACGLLEEAAEILEMTAASIADPDPVALYILGDVKERLGQGIVAANLREKAARHSGNYIYSFRREDETALRTALAQNPQDGLALALLGMLEIYRLNPERAVAELLQAVNLRPGWDQPLRLLAICQRMLGNRDSAARQLELAVAANPENPGLYAELDELLATLPDTLQRRKKLWSGAPGVVMEADHTLGRYAAYLVDSEAYNEALEVLHGHTFFPEEGSSFYRDLFACAHLGIAVVAAEAGELEQAIQHARLAATYPERLGLAQPFICYDALASLLEAALLQRRGEEASARLQFERAAHERHREINEAEYFSGLAYRCLGQEDEARAKFLRLLEKSAVDAAWPDRDHDSSGLLAVLGKAGFDNHPLDRSSFKDLSPALKSQALLYCRVSDLLLPILSGLTNIR
jgi:tetratricopeptide (TPR) repeat protein